MTLLFMLRHGPTAWNAEKRIQGSADVPLSAAGRATVAGWRLPAGFDRHLWVSSPLCRAMETATLLLGRPVPIEDRLREMAWGEWEGRLLAELRAKGGAAMAANEELGLDFQPPGGESPRDLQARLRPWLADVAKAGQPVGAVTHRGVIRAIYALAAGWDMTGRPSVRLDSGCLHVFRLAADGTPHIERRNLPLAEP